MSGRGEIKRYNVQLHGWRFEEIELRLGRVAVDGRRAWIEAQIIFCGGDGAASFGASASELVL